MPLIRVKHNFEAAHRLFLTEGKCEAIHGHSFWAELTIYGQVNQNGILEGLDFGAVKKEFRRYLDTNYDHQLLLNAEDPWAKAIFGLVEQDDKLPGLMPVPGDPTTENLAEWIVQAMGLSWPDLPMEVLVNETAVNAASAAYVPKALML